MREGIRNRFSISLACLLGFALLLSAGTALAKKPVPPDPDPDPTPVDVGTIYYTEAYSDGLMHAIGSDGTDLGSMHENVSGLAEPSLLLHPDSSGDDVRWFLQVEIADAANQLFAVSENGVKKRLLTDTTLHVGGRGGSYAYPRWADDDYVIGFCAVRYDQAVNMDENFDPDPDATIVGNETGQYLLTIDPETMTATGQPTYVPLPSHLTGLEDGARNLVSDVSPTGLSIVYQSYVDYKGTWRADASDWTDPTALLSGSFLYLPRWSPDEAWISGHTDAGIQVISWSGGTLTTVVPDPEDSRRESLKVDRAFWSPSGTHLGYRMVKTDIRKGTSKHEIHAVDLDTGSTTFLCDGYIRGWR